MEKRLGVLVLAVMIVLITGLVVQAQTSEIITTLTPTMEWDLQADAIAYEFQYDCGDGMEPIQRVEAAEVTIENGKAIVMLEFVDGATVLVQQRTIKLVDLQEVPGDWCGAGPYLIVEPAQCGGVLLRK